MKWQNRSQKQDINRHRHRGKYRKCNVSQQENVSMQ